MKSINLLETDVSIYRTTTNNDQGIESILHEKSQTIYVLAGHRGGNQRLYQQM